MLAPHDSTQFPWKSIWQNKALLKVVLFAWSAALGKILTMDNLRKRHVMEVDWYCICKKGGFWASAVAAGCKLVFVVFLVLVFE
jgi:hypothetical protein